MSGNINLYLSIMLSPLIASAITGILGNILGKKISHSISILGVLISVIGAIILFIDVYYSHQYYDGALYTWMSVGSQKFSVGILIDSLTATMLLVVSSVSLMVHIYTIGYMSHEEGYQRFFSYIGLFTFMMFVLVMSNNFAQLFFGWEGVGLVSYLLIGFYFKKESAISANLKAFLINRIGDLGFILGIALVLAYFGTLDYHEVFLRLPTVSNDILPYTHFHIIDVICILLFIGAMGKSAQFPLHVWLPDSMEGPTPISALIHAATMVTAGIFMVARLSLLYNLSVSASEIMIIVGGINCLFLGILGIVQNDIKRVVAYSTLSQLGYMVVALGCGAYSVAIFHLVTHAFFKGLLFLAAGSVIIAMHHKQDMRDMGGLYKYMPITYITMLIGSLALVGVPPFAGFFSKDMILDISSVAYHVGIPCAGFAVFTVYASVIVTSIYSFRLLFMTFHGQERFKCNVSESEPVVTIPLILMAIASIVVGYLGFNHFVNGSMFSGVIYNAPWYSKYIAEDGTSVNQMMLEVFYHLPIYLVLFGFICAWANHKGMFAKFKCPKVMYVLEHKYFMDILYVNIFATIGRVLGSLLWNLGDIVLIDGIVVNGSAKVVNLYARIMSKLQNGYINRYAIFMLVGLIFLLTICTTLIFM